MNRYDNSSLLLADGTALENSSCGFSDKKLWCWISGRTMADCFPLFSDPTKTNTISCLYFTMCMRYRGFTEIEIIRKGMDSMGNETVDIRLAPVGDDFSVEEFPIIQDPDEEEAEENAELS